MAKKHDKHDKTVKPEKKDETHKNIPADELKDDLQDASHVDETAPETKEEIDPIAVLENRVKEAEAAAAQSHDRLLRATAEHENYKKRAMRETAEFQKFANESLIKSLLPVIDNLERAIESAGSDVSANGAIIEGVKMTLNEIYKVLERFNLKALESEGKPFDPNFHQAVLQQESAEHPENTVLKEMQKGYLLHERLIRPAMVVVSKALPKGGNGEKTEPETADQTGQ